MGKKRSNFYSHFFRGGVVIEAPFCFLICHGQADLLLSSYLTILHVAKWKGVGQYILFIGQFASKKYLIFF